MNFRPLIWTALLPLTILSCQKDEDGTPGPPGPSGPSEAIRFDQPRVGQHSRYVLLQGERYFDPQATGDWTYLPDTLIQEIVAEEASGFLIEERLSEHSFSRTADSAYILHPDTVYRYYMQIEADSVHFFSEGLQPASSHFFLSGLESRKLPLAFLSETQTTFSGWKTTLPYCECYREAYAEDTGILGQTYDHLNVIIDNEAMQYDGPGYTYAYHPAGGMARYYYVSWWFQRGRGWDRLP